MKCLDIEQIRIDMLLIFREHIHRIEELEGHGLDKNGVVLIKGELNALFRDMLNYIDNEL